MTRTIRELSQGHAVMTYTQSQPEVLPSGIDRGLAHPRNGVVGICFGVAALCERCVFVSAEMD